MARRVMYRQGLRMENHDYSSSVVNVNVVAGCVVVPS